MVSVAFSCFTHGVDPKLPTAMGTVMLDRKLMALDQGPWSGRYHCPSCCLASLGGARHKVTWPWHAR